MRRLVVISLSTGLILIVASFALAAGQNHNSGVSHGAVPSAHKDQAAHEHTTGTANGHDHEGEHPDHSDPTSKHWGHSLLRWFHELIDRFSHPHSAPHTVPVTVTPHASEPHHAGRTAKTDAVKGLQPGGTGTKPANGRPHSLDR